MPDETAEDLFARYGPIYRWLVTGVGLIGGFSMILSATIVNVAVPNVMGAFGVGQDQAQWLATAFLATMTASQLLNHWVVTVLGPRGAFTVTITVFVVGTIVSAMAPNIDVLILGRVLQGFSAGIIQPMVMVVMFTVFPPERRAFAMGIYGAGVVLAPALGPAVGGIAIDALSWRYIFVMPLPFCMLALVGGLLFMPSRRRPERLPPFDWLGYGLLAASLALLLSGAANGPRLGWSSDWILFKLGTGAACATAFVIWQLRSRAPLLDFSLWQNRQFSAALVIAFVFGAGNFASSYVIPVFVQAVQGYTATRAGFLLMPAGLFLVACLPLTGRLADKLPDQYPIMVGLACFGFGTALMSGTDVNTPFWTFAIFAMIGRGGLAFLIPSLTASALRALPPHQLNLGSGNVNFIRQLGGAVGTNLIVVWLQQRTSFHADVLAATQTAGNESSLAFLAEVGDRLAATGLPDAVQHAYALHFLGEVVYAQALTFAFQDCFLALATVFFLAVVPAAILGRTARRS